MVTDIVATVANQVHYRDLFSILVWPVTVLAIGLISVITTETIATNTTSISSD
jgi:hypothetical protein